MLLEKAEPIAEGRAAYEKTQAVEGLRILQERNGGNGQENHRLKPEKARPARAYEEENSDKQASDNRKTDERRYDGSAREQAENKR
jgi:hypothetical protein